MNDIQQKIRDALDSLERIYAAADGFDVEEYEDPASGISGDVDLYRVRHALRLAGREIAQLHAELERTDAQFAAMNRTAAAACEAREAALRARVEELERRAKDLDNMRALATKLLDGNAALRARVEELEGRALVEDSGTCNQWFAQIARRALAAFKGGEHG